MDSKLVLYWIDTENQLADAASRHVDFNEEFVPQIIFRQVCRQLNIQPTVDCFASKANRKCERWINFGLHSDQNCIAFDFFSVNPEKLKNEVLWVFPPKNMIQQTMAHLLRYYRYHKFLLIFHSFGETPLGLPPLLEAGGKISNFPRFPASIVPAEKKLVYEGQEYWGFWNDKVKATKIISLNC